MSFSCCINRPSDPESNEEAFYQKYVNVSNLRQLSLDTAAQASSTLWRSERRLRITASRAHKIVHARSPEQSLKYFLDDGKDIENLPAIVYGRTKEAEAKKHFERVYGGKVKPCGLVVSAKYPWLSASPDGLVASENGDADMVLEIKCPYSCRDKDDIDVPYFKTNGRGLSQKHSYYTQIQLQLFCCNLKSAHFVIYKDYHTYTFSTVQRDDPFLNNIIPKLKKLYFDIFLPELVQRHRREAESLTSTAATVTK
jgi:putative phage-type endonuclease